MTAAQLIQATAGIEEIDVDRDELRAAAQAVDRFLADGGGVFLSCGGNDGPDQYEVFTELAAQAQDGKGLCEAAEANLQAFGWLPDPHRPGENMNASDEALTKYRPLMNAAYAFGLAMGLKVAGGKQ